MSNPKTFPPGTDVTCSALPGVAQVVEGPNSKGEYRVALGHLTSWVPASELKPAPKQKQKNSPEKAHKLLKALSEDSSGDEPIRVDLHGLTVPQAIDALERALDQGILKNSSRIEIIHGLGSGILKRAITDYLSQCSHVTSFKGDEKNPGTTWAFL